MTFTEADAENDGLIKREVGREMAKVAKTNNPEVFEHFENVAEQKGRDPADIFGEMALKALESQQFADKVLDSEVSMRQLRADEIRLEDVKYVKTLTEELGLNETEESTDPIDQLIDQRLQSISQSPIPRLNNDQQVGQGDQQQVAQHMQRVTQKIEELEQKVEGQDSQTQTDSPESEEDKSIDDLFGEEASSSDGDQGGEDVDVTTPDQGQEIQDDGEDHGEADDSVGVGDTTVEVEEGEEENRSDEGAPEDETGELLSPDIGGDFDEVVNSDQREGEAEEGDGGEDQGEQVDEQEDQGPAFSSEEATEE